MYNPDTNARLRKAERVEAAAREVVNAWESGDLDLAVQRLDAALHYSEPDRPAENHTALFKAAGVRDGGGDNVPPERRMPR